MIVDLSTTEPMRRYLEKHAVSIQFYLNLASDNISQCFPFKIVRKIFEARPMSSFSSCTIHILLFYQLTRFVVPE
jgi:hypothetical protein